MNLTPSTGKSDEIANIRAWRGRCIDHGRMRNLAWLAILFGTGLHAVPRGGGRAPYCGDGMSTGEETATTATTSTATGVP